LTAPRTLTASLLFCVLSLRLPPPPTSPLFPYTTLFRSTAGFHLALRARFSSRPPDDPSPELTRFSFLASWLSRKENRVSSGLGRSEEHTSELQSRENLVCRLLLEKKKLITATLRWYLDQ